MRVSVSVCEARLGKGRSENGPGPGDAAEYACVSPTPRQPLHRGDVPVLGEGENNGVRAPLPALCAPT